MEAEAELREGWVALAEARERRGGGRRLGLVSRVLFGVLPWASSAGWWLAGVGHSVRGVQDALILGVVALSAVPMLFALVVHGTRRDLARRTRLLALGVSLGVALVLVPYAFVHLGELFEALVQLPILLVLTAWHPWKAPLAISMGLWITSPLTLGAVCALDAGGAIRRLRGAAFGFRDVAWILCGLLPGASWALTTRVLFLSHAG